MPHRSSYICTTYDRKSSKVTSSCFPFSCGLCVCDYLCTVVDSTMLSIYLSRYKINGWVQNENWKSYKVGMLLLVCVCVCRSAAKFKALTISTFFRSSFVFFSLAIVGCRHTCIVHCILLLPIVPMQKRNEKRKTFVRKHKTA